MKTHLTNRARRMKHQARRLLCERLERRYAMHAMPWGYDEFYASVEDVDRFGSVGDFASEHNCDNFKELKGEGEYFDVVTGNLIPNGRPSVDSHGSDALPGHDDHFSGRPMNHRNFGLDSITGGNATANGVSLSTQVSLSSGSSKPDMVAAPSAAQSAATSNAAQISQQSLLGSSFNPTPARPQAQLPALPGNSTPRRESSANLAQTPAVTSVSSAIVTQFRTTDAPAAVNLLSQATTSYNSARSLSTTVIGLQTQRDLSTVEQPTSESTSTERQRISDELRSVIENLAQQREAQRSSAARHANEIGWDNDLAQDAIARNHRDVIHDDGLLELATLPERMSIPATQEPYAAIQQTSADQLSMTLVQVGSIHEFELAGEHLGNINLIANPEKMLTDTTQAAIAAVDQWHAEPQSDLQTANESIDSDISVLNRSVLPLSFLAVGGMLAASRRKYKAAASKAKRN